MKKSPDLRDTEVGTDTAMLPCYPSDDDEATLADKASSVPIPIGRYASATHPRRVLDYYSDEADASPNAVGQQPTDRCDSSGRSQWNADAIAANMVQWNNVVAMWSPVHHIAASWDTTGRPAMNAAPPTTTTTMSLLHNGTVSAPQSRRRTSSTPRTVALSRDILRDDLGNSLENIAHRVLEDCVLSTEHIEVAPSKLCGMVYIFGLDASEADAVVMSSQSYDPRISGQVLNWAKPTEDERFAITASIVRILDAHKLEKITYLELAGKLDYPLIMELPVDHTVLEEVRRDDFCGLVRAPPIRAQTTVHKGYTMISISLRKLAPIVHAVLRPRQESVNNVSSPPTAAASCRKVNPMQVLDKAFLERLMRIITSQFTAKEIASAPGRGGINEEIGEGKLKPLEHLVTCVPGVEIVWWNDQKHIRKLELNTVKQDIPGGPLTPPATTARGNQGTPLGKRQIAYTPSQQQQHHEGEAKITKDLTTILKDPSNQYMTLEDLGTEYTRRYSQDFPGSLRQYITDHVKHFQLLCEGDVELVTLSHRAQIKRICNDVQRALRRKNPKCLSTLELPNAFVELWQHTDNSCTSAVIGCGNNNNSSSNNSNNNSHGGTAVVRQPAISERWSAVFDVSLFGVCFLDDLMVTIPQHWGVHCSAYIQSSDGRLAIRHYGDGEEDVPDYIPLDHRTYPAGIVSVTNSDEILPALLDGDDEQNPQLQQQQQQQHQLQLLPKQEWDLEGYKIVHAWAPRFRPTPFQRKAMALFRQQLLNMYRGDPTAEVVKNLIERAHSEGKRSTELTKRIETACLRSNTSHGISTHKRCLDFGAKTPITKNEADQRHHMPCDFKLTFNQFIPTFHHVYNAQATVQEYGSKNLFEVFENMPDTIEVTHHEASRASITLTTESRREILERRLIFLMRREKEPIEFYKLIQRYNNERTMAPFFDEEEIKRAMLKCGLFDVQFQPPGSYLVAIKPPFSLRDAVARAGSDVAIVLGIFMRSFGKITFGELESRFEQEQRRPLPGSAFRLLLNEGAVRQMVMYSGSADSTPFDVQDVCRIVRNLIYQMNSAPDDVFYVFDDETETARLINGDPADEQRSLSGMLEFSGDCMCADFDIERTLDEFADFVEKVPVERAGVKSAYKLRPCVHAGMPNEEEQLRLVKLKNLGRRRQSFALSQALRRDLTETPKRREHQHQHQHHHSHQQPPPQQQLHPKQTMSKLVDS